MDLRRADRRLKTPTTWPVWVRRSFALGFPVSVPLWVGGVIVTSTLLALDQAWTPLAQFWSAPPKRLHSNNYYMYSSRSERSAKLVELPRKERKDAA